MEKWNKIINSNVVNIFRDIARDWWGIDIHFYDEFGKCKNNGFHLQHNLCSLTLNHSNKKIGDECLQFRANNLKGSNGSQNTFFCKNYENLKVISLPLTLKGVCIGYLMCSGMQFQITNQRREENIKRLAKLGFSEIELQKRYGETRISDSHTEDYVLRLMKTVANDISCFCGDIFDKNNTKIEQALLLDKRQNRKYESIIGRSNSMKKIFNKLDLFESSESPVLVLGETGTGKELIATAIHYNSVRKEKAFVIQNCSAFSDTILSSELFGHEKGSFTGAVLEKKGLFELADGGTLFLDEIGDLSIDVQAKLLRVLEKGTFYRVGGTEEIEVDVRVITATNMDLSQMVGRGLFRRDLFFRINTLQIKIPPLRERKEDIIPLFYSFLEHYSDRKEIGEKNLNPDIFEILVNHDWAGNVRELKNTVQSLLAMSSNSATIDLEHLLLEVEKTASNNGSSSIDHREGDKLDSIVSSINERMARGALHKASWNKTKAAMELGISRASLNRRIAKYNISKDK